MKVEPDQSAQARFDAGTRVGELAQQRWPGGVVVDAAYWDVDGALRQTQDALCDPDCSAIYEAGFKANRTSVRTDIMLRVGDQQWELWEAKSVLNPKEIHAIDYAIQRAVIQQWAIDSNFPLQIVRGGILHLNRDYIFDGSDFELQQLFAEHDLSNTVDDYTSEVQSSFVNAAAVIDDTKPPPILPGPHCSDPYGCPFLGAACEIPPHDELTLLPRIGANRAEVWHNEGIHKLDQLDPNSDDLNVIQSRALQGHVTGELQVGNGLNKQLDSIGYPRYHLDFESTGSWMILPRWKGTHPFQQVPFQFSLHLERGPGESVLHDGYLHADPSDPRRPLAQALIEQVSVVPGPILMYTPYERRMIDSLIEAIPDQRSELMVIRDRLVDLHPIIRDNVYHPSFEGCFSIKKVLPALVDDLSYKGLEIADGDTAALRYLEMIDRMAASNAGKQDPEVQTIHEHLWLYCQRDTEAMVALLNRLQDLA